MWWQVMEAQFFVHLRKYLFPPAVLALKHAMEGALFWFEKPLIVDSLIQLLGLLCPPNTPRSTLCDFIPLLFCWLFEQCNPTATDSDFFQLVTLIDMKSDEKRYFDDPATVISAESVPFILRERKTLYVNSIRHVDLRSLTRYMQNKTNYANITYCKSDEYLIYDPPKNTATNVAKINPLADDQMKQLYETMTSKYRSFMLITRGALRSDINDQLVLLQDRTAALVFTRKATKHPKTASSINTETETVEHLFEFFNPLQHKVGPKQYVKAADLYQVNTNGVSDSHLPKHLIHNVCPQIHTNSLYDPCANTPIQQMTYVLLDRSGSMFDKLTSSNSSDAKSVIDMSIIMLGTMSDNYGFREICSCRWIDSFWHDCGSYLSSDTHSR